MTTNQAIIEAALLGTEAYKAGKKCVPAQDGKLMEVIGKHEVKKMGASIPILKAWTSSFIAANLAEPYEI